jgi:hypothetical protein
LIDGNRRNSGRYISEFGLSCCPLRGLEATPIGKFDFADLSPWLWQISEISLRMHTIFG